MDTGLQSNNIEPNEENVDIIPPAPISRARLSLHTEDVVLVDTPQAANVGNGVTESTQVRSHTIAGLSSIRPVDSHITSGVRQMVIGDRGHGPPRTSTMNRRNSSDSSDDERSHRDRGVDLQKEIAIQAEIRDLHNEGPLKEEDPLIEEDTLIEEGPPERGRTP